MIITGLRFTMDNYTAVWGYKHIGKPDLVIRKPESENGNNTMMNALAVQQGTNGIYLVIILYMKLNRPIWY